MTPDGRAVGNQNSMLVHPVALRIICVHHTCCEKRLGASLVGRSSHKDTSATPGDHPLAYLTLKIMTVATVSWRGQKRSPSRTGAAEARSQDLSHLVRAFYIMPHARSLSSFGWGLSVTLDLR